MMPIVLFHMLGKPCYDSDDYLRVRWERIDVHINFAYVISLQPVSFGFNFCFKETSWVDASQEHHLG